MSRFVAPARDPPGPTRHDRTSSSEQRVPEVADLLRVCRGVARCLQDDGTVGRAGDLDEQLRGDLAVGERGVPVPAGAGGIPAVVQVQYPAYFRVSRRGAAMTVVSGNPVLS